jgi:hypothetical protein
MVRGFSRQSRPNSANPRPIGRLVEQAIAVSGDCQPGQKKRRYDKPVGDWWQNSTSF